VVKLVDGKKSNLLKNAFFLLDRGNHIHIISENYSYKTETYYTILQKELEGHIVKPSSTNILDAYTVPICLDRLQTNGVPVCDWMISQVYSPIPALIYGVNYFATTSDFIRVNTIDEAKDAIKHVTNNGKYPFCYQKIEDTSIVNVCPSIFGKTKGTCNQIDTIAKKVYDIFEIPLILMIIVNDNDNYKLSALAPMRYSQLTKIGKSDLLSYMEII
jgi:hypothetical protein